MKVSCALPALLAVSVAAAPVQEQAANNAAAVQQLGQLHKNIQTFSEEVSLVLGEQYQARAHGRDDDTCYFDRYQVLEPDSERNCYHAGFTPHEVCRRFKGIGKFVWELADLADRVTAVNVPAFDPELAQGALYKVLQGMFMLSDLLDELRRGLRVTSANFHRGEEERMEDCWDHFYVRPLIRFLAIVADFDNRFGLTYDDVLTLPVVNLVGESNGPTDFVHIFWSAIDLCTVQETLVSVFVSKIRNSDIRDWILNDQGLPLGGPDGPEEGQVSWYCNEILSWAGDLLPDIEDSPGPGHDGPGHDGPGRDGPGRDGPGSDGPGRDGPGRDGPGRDGPGRDGPGSDGPGRDGPGRDGPGSDGPGSDGPGRDGPGRDGPGSDGPD